MTENQTPESAPLNNTNPQKASEARCAAAIAGLSGVDTRPASGKPTKPPTTEQSLALLMQAVESLAKTQHQLLHEILRLRGGD